MPDSISISVLLYYMYMLSIKVAALNVIRVCFVIIWMNELVRAQSSSSDVWECVSSLSKSTFWSVPIIAFGHFFSLVNICS